MKMLRSAVDFLQWWEGGFLLRFALKLCVHTFTFDDHDDDHDDDNDDEHYPIYMHKTPYMGFCAYGILGAPHDYDSDVLQTSWKHYGWANGMFGVWLWNIPLFSQNTRNLIYLWRSLYCRIVLQPRCSSNTCPTHLGTRSGRCPAQTWNRNPETVIHSAQ